MLIEFSVANFLSFKDKKTLSMVAASIHEHAETNIIVTEKHELLNGAIIYGANASGKSNFIKALSTMTRLVLNSFERSSTDELGITPFLLNTETIDKPSFFEILFFINNIRYRYGFEVDNISIRSEWLYEAKKNIEKPLFLRIEDGIEVFSTYKEGKHLEEKTRDNALFLAVVDQFNGKIANSLMQWFKNCITISGLSHERYKTFTFSMLESNNSKTILQDFYHKLDLGFEDIRIIKKAFNASDLPKSLPENVIKQMATDFEGHTLIGVKTLHKKFDANNQFVSHEEFDMRQQESSGTNKVFNISGPIFDVLREGGVLVIDELDASLHPILTLAITKLFNSITQNQKNAQLIFSTHDTNLLSYDVYRRDQVYFIEKDNFGASDLYSLVEYKEQGKKIRKDRSFEKDYIQGRYGAIPYIGSTETLLGNG